MVRTSKERPEQRSDRQSETDPRSKLYEIRWLDAYEMESGWHSIEDALKITPPEVVSVGYVIAENDEYTIIAADLGSHKMDNDVGRVQVIPGQWIVDKKIIL